MKFRNHPGFGISIFLAVLGITACVSPVEEATKLAQSGNADAAYQHISKALAASPEDAKLKEQQVAFGDLAVADVLRRADKLPTNNLSGQEEVVRRARQYRSSHLADVENRLGALAAKKREVIELLAAQKNKPTLSECLAGLGSSAVFFKEDPELNAALTHAVGPQIGTEATRLAASGDFRNLLQLREDIVRFGLGGSYQTEFNIAVDAGFRTLLERRVSEVVPLDNRGEVALWAALLGHSDRRLKLAISIQGTVSQDFIEPLRNQIGALLGGSFKISFLSKPSDWKKDTDLLAAIELTDSGLKSEEQSAKKYSKYYAGSRQDPNPAYTQAQNAYTAAKANEDRAWQVYQSAQQQYQAALAQANASHTPAFLSPPVEPNSFASQFALGRLQSTAPTIDTPVYQDYEYVEKTTIANHFAELAIHLTLRADEFISTDTSYADKLRSPWYENLGVHPRDNSIGHGNYSPEAVQREAATFMGTFAKGAADKMTVALKDLALLTMGSAADQHLGQRFALGAAIACATTKPLDAEEAYPLAQAFQPQSPLKWRAEVILAALKRAHVTPEKIPQDLAADLSARFALTTAANPRTEPGSKPADTSVPRSASAATPALEHLLSAVVTVLTNDGSGTGFFVSAKGKLLTNYHVIEGAKEIYVRLRTGERLPAIVIDKNVNRDLAILQVSDGNYPVASLGDPETISVGTEVYAVGSPGGVTGILDYSVTRGIISAHRRFTSETNTAVELELLQTDAAINPGNSGGPLSTLDGHVVGINTWKVIGKAVQGLNFAVSINEARKYFYRHMD